MFFCSFFSVFGQSTTTYYLDDYQNEIAKDQHKYYQVITDAEKKNVQHQQTTFFLDGTIFSKGLLNEKFFPTGVWEFYYSNGNIKEKIFYDRIPAGVYETYYESGDPELQAFVIKGSKKKFPQNLRIENYWNSARKQLVENGNGYMILLEPTTEMEGKMKNGLKDSIWLGSSLQYKIDFAEVYRDGEFVSGVSVDANDALLKYTNIDEMSHPEDPQAFILYLQKNLKNLSKYIDRQHYSVLSLNIDAEGNVTDYSTSSTGNPELGKVIFELAKKYPKWIPKSHRGVKMASVCRIPISQRIKFVTEENLTDPSRRGQYFANPSLSENRVQYR